MLNATEQRILRELAASTAARDPRFARRMAAGPYGRNATRWRLGLLVTAVALAATAETVAGFGPAAGLAMVGALAATAALLYSVVRPVGGVRPA